MRSILILYWSQHIGPVISLSPISPITLISLINKQCFAHFITICHFHQSEITHQPAALHFVIISCQLFAFVVHSACDFKAKHDDLSYACQHLHIMCVTLYGLFVHKTQNWGDKKQTSWHWINSIKSVILFYDRLVVK